MKKAIPFILLFFSGAAQLFAQAPRSSLLWEISGKGLKAPSYLFGTFHIMCRDDFPVSETLKNKLRSTKQFFAEMKLDDPAIIQQMALKMMMKGKTIESIVGAEDYKKLDEGYQKITGMPLAMFNNFKPFMSISLLAQNMIGCQDKIQPESEFIALANAAHIPVLGLETLDDELNAIDKWPLDSQIISLKQSVFHFDSAQMEMKNLITVYKKRNIDSIYNLITQASGNGNFEKDMIVTRNNNWLPVIIRAMNDKSSFFAVGSGHLGGANGVISLLRKQGYQVTPVRF